MLTRLKIWIKERIIFHLKEYGELYNINDLQIGGHCGCCGGWIPDEIFDKEWSWGICKECKAGHIPRKNLTNKVKDCILK